MTRSRHRELGVKTFYVVAPFCHKSLEPSSIKVPRFPKIWGIRKSSNHNMASLLTIPEDVRQIIYYYVFRTPMWEQHLDNCKQRQGSHTERRRCCLMCYSMGDDRQSCYLQPCVIELQNNYFTLQRQLFWYDQPRYASLEGRYQRCPLLLACRALYAEASAFLYQHTPIFININKDTRACPCCGGLRGWHIVLEPRKFLSFRNISLWRSVAKLWITIKTTHDRDPGPITSTIRMLESMADNVREHPDRDTISWYIGSCSVCGRGDDERIFGIPFS